MTRVTSSALVCVLVVVAGCAAKPQPVATKKQINDPIVAPQGPVIVQLKGQHQTVTVTSGPDGPLYTAQDKNGGTIVANATLAELRTDHPEIYQFIEPAMAMDASLDGTARPAKSKAGSTRGASSDRFIRGPLMLDSTR